MSRHHYTSGLKAHLQSPAIVPDFDPRVLPSTAHDWQGIFDLLIEADFGFDGRCGFVTSCERALSGRLTSMSASSLIPLPHGGHASYRYNYQGQGAARIRLRISASSLRAGQTLRQAHHLNQVRIDRDDADWIFLRYLAQREARALNGLCQQRGKPVNEYPVNDPGRGISKMFRQLLPNQLQESHQNCSSYQI